MMAKMSPAQHRVVVQPTALVDTNWLNT